MVIKRSVDSLVFVCSRATSVSWRVTSSVRRCDSPNCAFKDSDILRAPAPIDKSKKCENCHEKNQDYILHIFRLYHATQEVLFASEFLRGSLCLCERRYHLFSVSKRTVNN